MKKLFCTIVILMALILMGMQNANAQTKVTVTFAVCYDECTTQENCVYRAYYSIDDTCGGLTHLCDGYVQQACDQFTGSLDIVCDGCTDETHNPCYRVSILLRKICIGPGGSHVICEGSDIEYFPCYLLIQGQTMPISWN
jgi:hypothetical protein